MPFEQKKKLKRDPGPPDHRQQVTLNAIDRTYSELTSVLLHAGCGSREMQQIINKILEPINAAKHWVLEN